MCRKDATANVEPPFPWFSVVILLACNLTEPIVMAVLFPMAPFMVAEWVEADEVGTWAGLLASSFNLASIPAGVFWGQLSDRIGRLPCMVAVLCGSAVSIVVFGLSTSLSHAMGARVLGGVFSGIGGLVNAGMRDITTESQRSAAMASVSYAYAVGFAIGPMLGGMLNHPAELLPFLKGSLFDQFPYLLPCVAAALLILVGGLGLCWLPTKPPQRSPPPCRKTSTLPAAPAAVANLSAAASAEVPTRVEPRASDGTGESEPAGASREEAADRQLFVGAASDAPPTAAALAPIAPACCAALLARVAATGRAARQPVAMLLIGYLFMNFGSIGSMETFPLYLMRNDTSGLSLPSVALGEVMLPQSVMICVMPAVYPRLSRRYGDAGALHIGLGALVLFSIGLPLLRLVKANGSLVWAGLMSLSALRGTVGPLIYPAMILLINRAVSADTGFWNGMISSVGATARAFSPFVFGHLFAVGTAAGHAGWPLDVTMPFSLQILSLGIAALLVATVPPAGGHAQRSPRSARHTQPWTRQRVWRALLSLATVRATRGAVSTARRGGRRVGDSTEQHGAV